MENWQKYRIRFEVSEKTKWKKSTVEEEEEEEEAKKSRTMYNLSHNFFATIVRCQNVSGNKKNGKSLYKWQIIIHSHIYQNYDKKL